MFQMLEVLNMNKYVLVIGLIVLLLGTSIAGVAIFASNEIIIEEKEFEDLKTNLLTIGINVNDQVDVNYELINCVTENEFERCFYRIQYANLLDNKFMLRYKLSLTDEEKKLQFNEFVNNLIQKTAKAKAQQDTSKQINKGIVSIIKENQIAKEK